MSSHNKDTMRVLEHVLQQKIYIYFEYVQH